jgi:NAD-dependent deacetylase
VWFGEIPYGMDLVETALWSCDLFVSIGTSGVVYPAAAFVHWARGTTLELNLGASSGASAFTESRQGPATHLVPAWVDEVLGNGGSGSS